MISGEERATPDAQRPGASGLVRSETSHLLTASQLVSFDAHRRRTNRLSRVIKTAARCLVDSAEGAHKWAMLTLTYAPDHDWEPRQLTGCMQAIRDYLARRGFKARYVWVLEGTKAFRPHYHVLIQLPRGITLPKPDKQGWWRYGFTKIEWARHAVGYLAKYATKAGLFTERGARSYGVSGLSRTGADEVAYWRAPRWARQHCGDDRPRLVRVRQGYARADTGEFLPSPYEVRFVGGVMFWFKKEGAAA